jgi:hypothetical protein
MYKENDIPSWVKNADVYEEYLELKKEFDGSKEREVICPSGKVIYVDNAQFKRSAIKEGFQEEDLEQFSERIGFFKEVAMELARLKAETKVTPGEKYLGLGSVIKKNILKEAEVEILEMFGRWFTSTEVHKALVERGYDLKIKDVEIFRRNNVEKIREAQNTLAENYDDLPLGIKRSRLEKLNYILNSLYNDFDKKGIGQRQKIELSKEIRGIIEQARKEVEGDELKLTVNGRIDVESTITAVMKNSVIMQDLTIAQMVMSRVCYRIGIPYNKMVHRLANSFYKKYNGFSKNDRLDEKPVYPSSIQYDIMDMRPQYEEWARKQEMENVTYADIVATEQEIITSASLREKLLERLNVKKSKYENVD